MIGGYAPTTEPPELRYKIYEGRVECEGEFERGVLRQIDLAPIFELDLYQRVVERAHAGWILHAAALEVHEVTIVFAGPSGAGKTTLTLALLARGAKLLTEEIVAIGGDNRVRGLARPIHLAGVNVPVGWESLEYPIRTEHGITTHLIAAPPSYVTDEREVSLLVRLAHGPDRSPQLTSLTGSTALGQLWPCTLRQYPADLALATKLVTRIPTKLCSTSSVRDAADLVENMALSMRP